MHFTSAGKVCGIKSERHVPGRWCLSIEAVDRRRMYDRKRNSKRSWDTAFAEKERERDRKRYPERQRQSLLQQREQVQLRLENVREELDKWQTASW